MATEKPMQPDLYCEYISSVTFNRDAGGIRKALAVNASAFEARWTMQFRTNTK